MPQLCRTSTPGVGPLARSLRVGRLCLDSNVVLAPMAGVTNLPFRLIAREAGAGLVFTETVSAKGLVVGGKKSWKLVETAPAAEPLAYQLFGSDPEVVGEATRQLADRGAALVDLNLGCPVKKFLKHGAGACLLRDPPAIAPIVAAMRRAIPHGVLSVKIRLGWDERSITAPTVARIAEAEGVDFVTVHGRTRAQLYRGRASRPRIAEVVGAVKVPVFANGDVETSEDVRDMLAETGAAGVMVGRGAMTNPWLFRQVREADAALEPTARDRAELVGRHLELMLRYFDDEASRVHMLKKYLAAYASGMPGAHEFRDHVCRAHELQTVLTAAHSYFGIAP